MHIWQYTLDETLTGRYLENPMYNSDTSTEGLLRGQLNDTKPNNCNYNIRPSDGAEEHVFLIYQFPPETLF